MCDNLVLTPLPFSLLPVIKGADNAYCVVLPSPDPSLSSSTAVTAARTPFESSRVHAASSYSDTFPLSIGPDKEIPGSGIVRDPLDVQYQLSRLIARVSYSTSPFLSALHLLSSVVLCKALMSTLPHKNTCNNLLTFLVFHLRDSLPNFVGVSLLFLTEVTPFLFLSFSLSLSLSFFLSLSLISMLVLAGQVRGCDDVSEGFVHDLLQTRVRRRADGLCEILDGTTQREERIGRNKNDCRNRPRY